MITPSEKSRLVDSHREPVDVHAVLCKCAAGLLVIVGVAVAGYATGDESLNAAINAPKVATGH